MATTVESVLSMPNNTVGASKLNVSPYFLDTVVVGIIATAWYVDSTAIQFLALLTAALLAIWAALSAKRLRLYILDTPKSKIGSAAQGFVALRGKCRFYGDRVTQGFMHGPPCVWHRYTIVGLFFPLIDTGESEMPFIISDETVKTNGCTKTYYSERTELANVLKTWKQDPAWLLEEFDADKNGKIDFEEWEGARARAVVIARNKYEDKREDHVETAIRRPANGMPLLISDKSPTVLARRFRMLGYFNLFVAAGCVLWLCFKHFPGL